MSEIPQDVTTTKEGDNTPDPSKVLKDIAGGKPKPEDVKQITITESELNNLLKTKTDEAIKAYLEQQNKDNTEDDKSKVFKEAKTNLLKEIGRKVNADYTNIDELINAITINQQIAEQKKLADMTQEQKAEYLMKQKEAEWEVKKTEMENAFKEAQIKLQNEQLNKAIYDVLNSNHVIPERVKNAYAALRANFNIVYNDENNPLAVQDYTPKDMINKFKLDNPYFFADAPAINTQTPNYASPKTAPLNKQQQENMRKHQLNMIVGKK